MKKRGGGRLEHTPLYEKETKRLENNIVETTSFLFFMGFLSIIYFFFFHLSLSLSLSLTLTLSHTHTQSLSPLKNVTSAVERKTKREFERL